MGQEVCFQKPHTINTSSSFFYHAMEETVWGYKGKCVHQRAHPDQQVMGGGGGGATVYCTNCQHAVNRLAPPQGGVVHINWYRVGLWPLILHTC